MTNKTTKKDLWNNFKNFFLNYFWLGLIFILTSMFINEVSSNEYWKLSAKLLETIGIAMFIASLFSFTFESVSFQDKMQNIVEKIVLKRAFLSDLPRERKKDALHNLLKPSEREMEKYSNIEDFYNSYIDEVLNVSQRNVRSNYNINIKAKFDAEKDCVFTDGIYSYRLYPSEREYTDILVGFLKDDLLSTVDVIINLPNGERKHFKFDEIKTTFETNEIAKIAKIEVNEFCSQFNHVDVELRVKEYGHNHWMNVFFKAEQATDGFKMSVICDDNLTIKTNILFDVGHNYHVDKNEEDNEIHISCHQWINEGSGVSMIISKPEVIIQNT
ncbi:MAG: hypothetical protein CL624_07475 [Arcobacter sp.]|nr:hypothetical protein [Arcobacter sp.]|tara:strand:- start:1531 stop:2517 length:987 start_codon:yes stop_codon:yes gene_type:complete